MSKEEDQQECIPGLRAFTWNIQTGKVVSIDLCFSCFEAGHPDNDIILAASSILVTDGTPGNDLCQCCNDPILFIHLS